MKAKAEKKIVSKRKYRSSPRKELSPVKVSYISSLTSFSKLTREGQIVEASATGLLVLVERNELIAPQLRKNLSIDELVGEKVYMRLDDMNLEISGVVARTEFKGKKGFLIAIDYTDDAPEYWRECLMELLPVPGEID
jgi:hypothetical protein